MFNQIGAFGSRGPASAWGSSKGVLDWHPGLRTRKEGREDNRVAVALCPPRNLEAPSLSAFVKAMSCSSGESCQSSNRGSESPTGWGPPRAPSGELAGSFQPCFPSDQLAPHLTGSSCHLILPMPAPRLEDFPADPQDLVC